MESTDNGCFAQPWMSTTWCLEQGLHLDLQRPAGESQGRRSHSATITQLLRSSVIASVGECFMDVSDSLPLRQPICQWGASARSITVSVWGSKRRSAGLDNEGVCEFSWPLREVVIERSMWLYVASEFRQMGTDPFSQANQLLLKCTLLQSSSIEHLYRNTPTMLPVGVRRMGANGDGMCHRKLYRGFD